MRRERSPRLAVSPRGPSPQPGRDPPPDWLAARILHKDDLHLVLDKPAGLPVHRGPSWRPGGPPTLEDWLPMLAMGKRRPPQPAHRLDTDTAGCLVLGRTKPALAALGGIFAAGRAEKTYWAVLATPPPGAEGRIDAPLRKTSSRARGWRMEVHPEGQPASTTWRLLSAAGGLAAVELRPLTGRTHQLRVHMAHLGCPILGDPFYGTPSPAGLHLLARSIRLPPPAGLHATAPVPAAMQPGFARAGLAPDHHPGRSARR